MTADRRTSTVSLRRASAADLPAVAALAARVWRAHYPGIISPDQIEYMLARMYDLAVLERERADGTARTECLYDDADLVGFASWGPLAGPQAKASDAKLHKLYVDTSRQRRGHGRRLLGRVEELAAADGFRRIVLAVNKRNTAARAAYERCGFRVVSGAVTDIGGGFVMDDWIMEKLLR